MDGFVEYKMSNGLMVSQELSLKCTNTLYKAQKCNNVFKEDHSELSSKPSLSFIALIAKAILSTASRKLNLSSIYRYIEEHFPYFKTRHQGWRNSIRHNLSLNDCFVKLGRCEDGKGHYWGIHPAHLDNFLRGDFRQHRKANRTRQQKAFQNQYESCGWITQSCDPLGYWNSRAITLAGWVQMNYPWNTSHQWNRILYAEWMYYPLPLHFTGIQSLDISTL